MSLAPDEWECLDTQSLQQSTSIKGSPAENILLASPVHDLVDVAYTACKEGRLSLNTYRDKVQSTLETMFNLTGSEVASLVNLSQSQISATASSLVKAFLKASSKDLGIGLNTMYNTSTKTIEELFESPVYELYEIIPYIIRSAVQTPASQLHMTGPDTLFILKLSADNATIAQYKYAAKYVLPNIIISKNKFENDLIGKLMTDKSISDNSILANTTLHLLLTTSGFDLDTMKTIYGMNDAQISVLSLLYIKDLIKHCNLDLAAIKSHSSYNLTALLVGIATKSATCKSTTFYVAAKAKQMQELDSVCSTVTSTTLPLMRMVEQCTNLTWRYNARILGVNMNDWPQMDILTRDKLSQYSDLNKDKIKTSTLVSLLAKANSIHTTSDTYETKEVPTYNIHIRSELYSVFSTNTETMSSILGLPKATIDSYSALVMVEKLQEFLKLKYTINLSSTASTIGVSLDKLKYLAPTEWHEMIPTLKNEIVSSGSKQLSVTENNFKLLLALTDVAGLSYSNLQLLWDTTFKRLFTGKNLAENKTISTIQTMKGISLVALHKETPLAFYNKYLNLTKTDMSILFAVKQMDFDAITRFTFKELACSCKVSELQLLGVTPLRLMSSMTGKSDVALCRSIAILEGFRSLSMDSLKTKFNVTWNDTQPLLIVAQSLSDLPYEKISWGLGSQVNDWPLLHAVSIDDYTKIASINTTALANLSFHNVSALIIQNKNSFASQLQTQHISLVKQASSMFNVSSTDVCGQCDIPSTDVLKKFLYHLGGILYLDPRVIPLVNGFDCITHDSFVLQPSKWRLLLPGIIPQSFKNISMILHNPESKLEAILGSSKSNISNLALHEYIQLVTSRIKPMVECYRTVNTDNTLTKVLAKGKDISFMKQQTFIQTLSLICSDVNVYNMTSIMGWEGTNLSILHNYTMDDAALCKIMSITSVLSRSMVALANMMINEVHNCVVIPCRSGTLRDQEYYNCTDVNECKAKTPVCKTNQMCQNYHGGHECECDAPGFCMDKNIMTCNKCLRFLLTITFDIVFTNDLEDLLSPGFYLVKEKIQKNVDNAFRKLVQYIRCRLIKLRKGSVIAETSVYTSSEYGGTSQDLEKFFNDNLNKTNGQSYLGDLKVKTALLSDYNECTRNQDNCHQYATCENKQGTFQCVCNSGYEGDGITCEAGFLKTYWWLVIVLAVILVIIIIVIIVLVVKKPRLKSYGVDEELPPIKRSDSNLSYQNGDVYYKDKAGNTRAGTQYNAVPAERTEPTNPIYGQDIPENVYESQSQWNQNIYALDNLGADKDDGIEMKPKTNPIKENNHPGVNGSTTQDQAL